MTAVKKENASNYKNERHRMLWQARVVVHYANCEISMAIDQPHGEVRMADNRSATDVTGESFSLCGW